MKWKWILTVEKIYNRTKGTEFQGQAFPEFMQKLIAAGGLVNYTNNKRK